MTATSPQFNAVNLRDVASVQISTGATGLSDAIDLGGWSLSSITPSTSWTAADLTVQVSLDRGTTYSNLYDSNGNEYTITISSSRTVAVPIVDFIGFGFVKFRSGSGSTAIAQTATRTLTLGLVR